MITSSRPEGGTPARAVDPDDAVETDPYAAVGSLYSEHRLELTRLALLLLDDRRGAEDVVQDAFVGLLRNWPRLRAQESALAYLRASVVNRARSQLRRRAVARRVGVRYEPPVWSAEAAALVGEERRAVLEALRGLPPRRRLVLVLRYYLNLSDDEIAQALGIAPATVRSTATRAVRALGDLLGEEDR
ncbi:sigma-70 family RNA polymerase sigma factor [Frankia sp. CNm7]|uniref:Sigma-70 family RNA polymerase sigma factor n=2 Tax=Frankia nepalensis TaxID=1836974 RepID=A0A937UTK1_9ACTN|nr:sigma-70 family RNA polymerase sigma factor [Frankia nepalensis]MBL7508883.1 sigma-70 family RNA polymerase sigma factor [Frankia nepalensis]MBL7520331.1 sigma-70 family RNA polymerase sigma factor [Frankia nepalensis]MBL7630106.1 sigma-70 family RNA polymerase sigma factor [Frankia nepalensis]